MPIPPAIDPRALAAEIEAAAAEFNRLAMLATAMHITVKAEIQERTLRGVPLRPFLTVQVVAPL